MSAETTLTTRAPAGPGEPDLQLAVEPAARTGGVSGGPAGSGRRVRCTIAWPREAPLLADVVPVFEQLGVRVAEHRPLPAATGATAATAAAAATAAQGAREEFGLVLPDVTADQAALEALRSAFVAAVTGRSELDGLSRLVLTARLTWREISVVRAAARYLRQAGLGLSPGYVEETVQAWPEFAHRLVDSFAARFDPDAVDPRAERAAEARLDELLEGTTSLDSDRILRGLREVLGAVVRTNYYQVDAGGSPPAHLSLKIEASRLAFLPQPRPLVETFVVSPAVEGLHLRSARVSRGGLRWSDRPEDYRTEVLGLLKAQMVKNAVIVPAGAKGAFVVRRPLAGLSRPAVQEVVREAYRAFIGGLLDVTDTIRDGVVVHPARCVVRDQDDPYLVVAADKGTATFSDLANEVAAAHGHWLGDAFASGGSHGYDHKAMGITARGAWVSVRRHFRELGVDVDTDPVSVVGIGDMSGDVFGNGMLLSRSLRLVAAFDHRHVFLDPAPDPAASYAERLRLSRLPSSSWADYDAALISTGGGVWPRDAKSVPLSPEVRGLLGVDAEQLAPSELIRAVLRAPVDLLWNGGIGTYVKASTETDADAADRANDAVRVDADTVRARVVGEGGNLGITQRARIELARRGGRINTDFIDNSAGVDTSDREVNLKILLDAAVADGELGAEERHRLLAGLTDEVAAAVLADSSLQARAISACAAQGAFLLDRHARLIHNLEQRAGLDRALEHLPSEAQLERLRADQRGLSRPEVAVLLAFSKNLVSAELLASDLPDEPAFAAAAQGYFPAPVRERFAARIERHPLVREIVATQVANDLLNRMGPGFLYRLEERNGTSATEAARAYATVVSLFDLHPVWAELDRCADQLAPDAEHLALADLAHLVERASDWVLLRAKGAAEMAALVPRFSAPVAELARTLQRRLDDPASPGAQVHRRLVAGGVPPALAARLAVLRPLDTALDVAVVAERCGASIADADADHAALGEQLGLGWLQDHLERRVRDTHWVLAAKSSLRQELGQQWAVLSGTVTASPSARSSSRAGRGRRAAVAAWMADHAAPVARFTTVLEELRAAREPDVAILTVALHELRRLVEATAPEGA